MPWVRFDDQYSIHRKVGGLSDAEYRLHTDAIFWCARGATDGVIRDYELRSIMNRSAAAKYAAELVRRGAWHPAGYRCASQHCPPNTAPDGWVVHDYFAYQPTRQKIEKERADKARRQANWLAKKKTTTSAARDGPIDASQDTKRDASITLTPPPPPLPKEERGGGRPEATAARRAAAGAGDGGRTPNASPPSYDEDPQVIAAEQARLAQEAEARIHAIAADRQRATNGAARARAAIADKVPLPRRDAMAELRALTDPPAQPDPANDGDTHAEAS